MAKQQFCVVHGVRYTGNATCPLCQWDGQRKAMFPGKPAAPHKQQEALK